MRYYYLKLKFWILRKLNDDEPSELECDWALKHICGVSIRIERVVANRAYGATLEEIATVENVTRERVRQMILKGVACSWKQYKLSLGMSKE